MKTLIQWYRRKKMWIIGAVAFAAVICVSYIFYHFLAHPLIKYLYEGKSIGFLEQFMQSRNVLPMKFYEDEVLHYYCILMHFLFYFMMACLMLSMTKDFILFVIKIFTYCVISLIMLEGVLALMLHFPFLAKGGLLKIVQNIYFTEYRNIIQYESDCSRYDPEITYTLKPGSCTFANLEYKNRFEINHLGLRDDEESLSKPDIIVLGDSYAMGWGVDQDKTYAQQIEKDSGLKILNTAISSYGTVREMKMLDRVDTSNCKYLIIHYCTNDFKENNTFYKNNNTINIMDKDTFQNVINDYQKQKRYYPGKYIIAAWRSLNLKEHKNFVPEFERHGYYRDEGQDAHRFLNALLHASHVDLSTKTIIVLANENFIQGLEDLIAVTDEPKFIKSIKTVNLNQIINKEHRYTLDDHINAKGHRIIADVLLEMINDNSVSH